MKTKGSILIQRDANKWSGILESSRISHTKSINCSLCNIKELSHTELGLPGSQLVH